MYIFKFKKCFLLIFLLFNSAFAQKHEITGVVDDKVTGKHLGYASIRIDETTSGTASNNEGQFILKLNQGSYKLIFSYVGYKTDTILVKVPDFNKINVHLQPEPVKLEEVVVNANEDPAYRIIRETIKRKKENRKGLRDFEYNAYSKKILKSGGEVAAIEETFVEGYNKINKWEKEFILAIHKTENQKKEIHSMDFSISDSYYIDFSKDTLTLLMNKIFLPLADNAFDYYDYKLLDVKGSAKGDIYRIKVIPLSSIQPLLKGEITIESSMYALTSVDLEINKGVRFPFVNDLYVKMVQQLSKYKGYWLPNYIETKTGFVLSFQGLIALDKIQIEEVNSITGYKINIPIPDSIENAVKSKYGGYTADTSGKGNKPLEFTRAEINDQRPIPLTKSEIKAYADLDSTKTIDKMIKVKGLLSGLLPEPGTQNDTTRSFLSGAMGILTKYIMFGNNRVTGILLGPRYEGPVFKNILSVDLSGGYSFQRKKPEGDLKINYKLKNFLINRIDAEVFNKSKSWQLFTPYTEFMNTVAVSTGFDDQFNYYLSSGFSLGINKYYGKNLSVKLGFSSENESSLPELHYQSIFKTNRKPRINPEIVEGFDRKAYLKISLGKDPVNIQFIPEDGLTARFDFSDPAFGSYFNYRRYRIIGLIKMNTFYRELFIAPYLEIIVDAGIITGNYGPQHMFSPPTSLGFFAPLQVFKNLKTYQFDGSSMLALHMEHNWRTIPFQALGLNFISDLYIDFITGISVLKTWNKSGYMNASTMDSPYWEVFAGFSRILGAFRTDISYNSFRNISVTASVGIIL